ncbi:MAG: peptidylprolyl isomerase [Bacteroidetes bacterium]|nr:peptidylprolyl isomerase [Bacteroidota bacterium]
MKKHYWIPIFVLAIIVINRCAVSKKGLTSGKHIIGIETRFGVMEVRLYDATPIHRDNFLKLASQGYYDSTTFFRVINQFMMQGGSSDSRNAHPDSACGEHDTLTYTIAAELIPGLYHKKGVLAQAREDNPEKRSHGGEFYIVQGKIFLPDSLEAYAKRRKFTLNDAQRKIYTTVGGTPHLDGNYTVYGEVIKGIEIIDSICSQKTTKALNDRPLQDVPMRVWVIK